MCLESNFGNLGVNKRLSFWADCQQKLLSLTIGNHFTPFHSQTIHRACSVCIHPTWGLDSMHCVAKIFAYLLLGKSSCLAQHAPAVHVYS